MDDFGLPDDGDWYRQALKLNGTAIGPPQGIPGVFNGVMKGMGPQPPQDAPAGNSGALDFGQFGRAANRTPPGGVGLLDTLNPVPRAQQLWQQFKAANDRAFGGQPPPSGMAGIVGGGFPPGGAQAQTPQAPPPQLPQGNVQPVSLNQPAQPSFGPTGPIPYFAPPQQQAANVPPPQAVPSQPQQMPAIPPASPVGRTQAAQGQGNPLDKYFQQMMALQRQRQLLAMAGGLLGAPSLGQGLGRAFTNASETMAPQGDLVSRIAGAQAAYQNTRSGGGSEKDAQNAAMANLMGAGKEYWDSVLNPKFNGIRYMGRDINFENRGGVMVEPKTGFKPWVWGHMAMGPDGKPMGLDDPRVHIKSGPKGERVIQLSDGRFVNPDAPDEQSAVISGGQ